MGLLPSASWVGLRARRQYPRLPAFERRIRSWVLVAFGRRDHRRPEVGAEVNAQL